MICHLLSEMAGSQGGSLFSLLVLLRMDRYSNKYG